MGKVIIYTSTGCRHCVRAKKILEDWDVSYVEINLSLHPECRQEMVLVTGGKKTVPQIFFDNEHIGGVAELEILRENGGLAAKLNTIERKETLKDTSEMMLYNEQNTVALEEQEIEDICVRMRSPLLGIKLDKGFGKKNLRCFTGKTLLEWTQMNLGYNEEEAMAVGKKLVEHGWMTAIKEGGKETTAFQADNTLYRFRQDEDPYLLNNYKLWIGEKRSPVEISMQLHSYMLQLVESFIAADGKTIDYPSVKHFPAFYTYSRMTLELQSVDVSQMELVAAKAFWINIYHCLKFDASVHIGTPKNSLQRKIFFSEMGYKVGSMRVSLIDIEHGILRGNRKPMSLKKKKVFAKKDPRRSISLEPDPRIHFALNPSTRHSPIIRVYSQENVDEGLTWATDGFLDEEVTVAEDGTVTLPRVFNWYSKDFGATKRDILIWVAQRVSTMKQVQMVSLIESKKFTIKYSASSWDQSVAGAEEDLEIDPKGALFSNLSLPRRKSSSTLKTIRSDPLLQTKLGRTGGGSVRVTRTKGLSGGELVDYPTQMLTGSQCLPYSQCLSNMTIQALSPEANAPTEEEDVIDTEPVTSAAAALLALQIQVPNRRDSAISPTRLDFNYASPVPQPVNPVVKTPDTKKRTIKVKKKKKALAKKRLSAGLSDSEDMHNKENETNKEKRRMSLPATVVTMTPDGEEVHMNSLFDVAWAKAFEIQQHSIDDEEKVTPSDAEEATSTDQPTTITNQEEKEEGATGTTAEATTTTEDVEQEQSDKKDTAGGENQTKANETEVVGTEETTTITVTTTANEEDETGGRSRTPSEEEESLSVIESTDGESTAGGSREVTPRRKKDKKERKKKGPRKHKKNKSKSKPNIATPDIDLNMVRLEEPPMATPKALTPGLVPSTTPREIELLQKLSQPHEKSSPAGTPRRFLHSSLPTLTLAPSLLSLALDKESWVPSSPFEAVGENGPIAPRGVSAQSSPSSPTNQLSPSSSASLSLPPSCSSSPTTPPSNYLGSSSAPVCPSSPAVKPSSGSTIKSKGSWMNRGRRTAYSEEALAEKETPETLLEILKDIELALLFRDYMHTHYSNENLAFWTAVEDYRKLPEEDRKRRKLEIYATYFDPSSLHEINVSNKLRKILEPAIKTDSADPSLFDAAQKEIWTLMEMDSYPKFICSETYHEYKRVMKERSRKLSLFQRKKPKMEQRLAEMNSRFEQRKKRTESLILLQNFIQSKPTPMGEAPEWLKNGKFGFE